MSASMTSRERVLAAINHQKPDRVPFVLNGCTSTSITTQAYINLAAHLGIPTGKVQEYSVIHDLSYVNEAVMNALDIDVRPVVAELPMSKYRTVDLGEGAHMLYDEWHCGWERRADSIHYIPMDCPLNKATSVDEIESFDWPDPDDSERFADAGRRAADLREGTEYAVYGNIINSNIFLRCTYLRGFERFLMDTVANKEFAHALLAKVTEVQLGVAVNFLNKCGKYLDIIRVGDDIATQDNLLLSPPSYREFIKPYHNTYFSRIKELTDAKLMYHTCGAVYSAIPDLIEIGVDILNPIQVTCKNMSDTKKLKDEFGDKLAFCGGIDTQKILPFGTPEEVEQETCRRIRDLAPGGGYLLAAVHNFQGEVPPENIVRMFDAGKKCS
jgi:uroporphyrinogen decarboxylase